MLPVVSVFQGLADLVAIRYTVLRDERIIFYFFAIPSLR